MDRLSQLEHAVARLRATLDDLLTREVSNTEYGEILSASGVAGVAVTLLDAGTIDHVAAFLYVVYANTGTDTRAGTATIETNDTQILYTDGTDTLTLACSAAGALTVQRTAGADTFEVELLGVWI